MCDFISYWNYLISLIGPQDIFTRFSTLIAARVEKLRELEILWGAYDVKYLHARPICYGGFPRCIQMQMPKCDDSLQGSELFVASLDDASCPTWQCRLLCDLAYFPFSSACKVCPLFACQRRTPNIPMEKKVKFISEWECFRTIVF